MKQNLTEFGENYDAVDDFLDDKKERSGHPRCTFADLWSGEYSVMNKSLCLNMDLLFWLQPDRVSPDDKSVHLDKQYPTSLCGENAHS